MEIKITGLPIFLTILFSVLKLCGVIAWSWWWVTCPLWIGLAISLGILIFGLIFGGGLLSLVGLLSLFSRKK